MIDEKPMGGEPPSRWLRRLWERMLAMYGHPWHSVHGMSPQDEAGNLTVDGDTWGKALVGITGAQLAAGLQACMAEGAEFPPSAPRFRGMCLGIPSLTAVRLDKSQADPFTRLVWQNVDAYRHTRAMAEAADRMLLDAYQVAREHVMRGGELPPEPAALIEQERRKVVVPDEETRAAILERARAEVGEAAP